jgi:hypothetical protein
VSRDARRGAIAWSIGGGLAGLLALAACVDGKTPNCSDAAAGCGPDVDGAILPDTGSDAGDAGIDAPPGDAATDAGQDAPPVDAPVDTGSDARDAKAG